MRIAVTGATGLIGSRLCRELSARDHELTVLSRDPVAARATLDLPGSYVRWNPAKHEMESGTLASVDAVVNLAGASIGEGRWSAKRKDLLVHSRTSAAKLLGASLHEDGAQPQRWIQASAIGYYGTGDTGCDEQSPVGHDFLARLCQKWEAAARQACPHGTELRTVRIGIVLSPTGGMLGKLYPLFARGLGGKTGSGRQWLSWIHLDDIVRILVAAVEARDFPDVCNGVAGQPIRQKEFARMLCNVLGRRMGPPAPSLLVRAALGQQATIALDGQQVTSRHQQIHEYIHFGDLEKALKDLLAER